MAAGYLIGIALVLALLCALVLVFAVSGSLFTAGIYRKSRLLKLTGIPAAILLIAGVGLGGFVYQGVRRNRDAMWIFTREFGRSPQEVYDLKGAADGLYASKAVYLAFRISPGNLDRLLGNRFRETDITHIPPRHRQYYTTPPDWWRPPEKPSARAFEELPESSGGHTRLSSIVYDTANQAAYYSWQ